MARCIDSAIRSLGSQGYCQQNPLRANFTVGFEWATCQPSNDAAEFDARIDAKLILGEEIDPLAKPRHMRGPNMATMHLAKLITLNEKSLIHHGSLATGIRENAP